MELCTDITSDNHRLQAYLSIASTKMALKKYQDCIMYYVKATNIDNTNYEIYFHLANAHYMAFQYDDAIKNYIDAISIISDDDMEEIPEIYYNLGNSLYAIGKYKDALKFFIKTIKIDPKNAEAVLNLGNTHFMLTEYVEASKSYKLYERLVGASNYIKVCLIKCYLELGKTNSDFYNKAELLLKELIKSEPTNDSFYYEFAQLNEKQEKYREALKYYEKVLELNENSPKSDDILIKIEQIKLKIE